jgi:hypothetical protein
MPPDNPDDDSLNLLLDELEVRAREQHAGERSEGYWVCQRKHPRSPFRAACVIHFFQQGSSAVTTLNGRSRNISRSGVGLLVRRVFRNGEPIEVELLVPGRARMHLGGLVTFCRYAGRGYHEVGVALKAAGSQPIFSKDPAHALESLAWLRNEFVKAM